jgi:hypothetical protein
LVDCGCGFGPGVAGFQWPCRMEQLYGATIDAGAGLSLAILMRLYAAATR